MGEVRVVPNRPVLLRHVADVEIGSGRRETLYRANGEPSVGVYVFKEESANLVRLGRELRRRIEEINEEFGALGIRLLIGDDAAELVQMQIDRLRNLGLSGFGIALLVLFFFLRQWRAVAVVAVAVPVSLAVALSFLYVAGLSLNLFTLFGLAIGVGLIVDNSVVVFESVQRHLERGRSPDAAAAGGIRRSGRHPPHRPRHRRRFRHHGDRLPARRHRRPGVVPDPEHDRAPVPGHPAATVRFPAGGDRPGAPAGASPRRTDRDSPAGQTASTSRTLRRSGAAGSHPDSLRGRARLRAAPARQLGHGSRRRNRPERDRRPLPCRLQRYWPGADRGSGPTLRPPARGPRKSRVGGPRLRTPRDDPGSGRRRPRGEHDPGRGRIAHRPPGGGRRAPGGTDGQTRPPTDATTGTTRRRRAAESGRRGRAWGTWRRRRWQRGWRPGTARQRPIPRRTFR